LGLKICNGKIMLKNNMFDRILVTGGCGFIGSNFIHYFLNQYSETKIINLDALTYAGNIENLKDLENNPRYNFVKGDIRDKNIVDKLMKKCDAIIHFAAESHVDRSIEDAGEFIQTNVFGTYVLLQSALKELENGKKIKRFVMVSTDEVYGDIPKGYSSKEKDTLMPRNPYAASKAGADRLAYSFHETHGLPVVITRSSNNFGPYQYPEKVLPLFITNLLEKKKIPLYGDGLNIRDWLYVIDNCRAMDVVLQKGLNGEVYNIGGGNEKQNIELTRKLLEIMDYGEDFIKYVDDRKGHDRRYSLDSAKIKKELGWKPQYDFDTALKETVNWYVENKNWWKKLK
jgi:dTDP-glucose 4,6-dehydratase